MTDGKNFFDQPINSDIKTYKNIRQIATGQGYDYTNGCLLDFSYFKDHYKRIAIDLNKQQALDVDPGAIQQIHFPPNLDRTEKMFYLDLVEKCSLLLEKQKKLFCTFHKEH